MKRINPYESPKAGEQTPGTTLSTRFWLGAFCSLTCSVSSLLLVYLYGYWHWYQGPWGQSLPGRLGLSWIFAVDGSKTLSMLLAVLSLVITIVVFRAKGRVQGIVSLPTCLLSVMMMGFVT